MNLVPWSKRDITPFTPFRTLRDELEDLFGSALEATPFWSRNAYMPAINVRDDDKQVYVTAELPGFDKKDVDIQVDGDTLVLRGERKEDAFGKGDNWWRRESAYGSFARRVTLPCEVDAAHTNASMANGILTIKLPKATSTKAKTIEVT
jgi:HSP20 family protein